MSLDREHVYHLVALLRVAEGQLVDDRHERLFALLDGHINVISCLTTDAS